MALLRLGSLRWAASRRHPLSHAQHWRRDCACVTAAAKAAGGPGRRLTLIHFNDVYDILARTVEPVGGAARFATLVGGYQAEHPLVLFGGDCLNPSLLSAFTKGEQMVPILNGMGVAAAVVGNHDFDFGVDVLRQRMAGFAFPWLLSNVLDATTLSPLAGADRSVLVPWQGVNVGLMGLVEREWLLTIPSIEADKDIVFLDFVEEGRRLARELRARGADVVVALTHMRGPNDAALAAAVPEIQLILGGHDHDYEVTATKPHGTMLFKSGSDFRQFSVIRLTLPPAPAGGSDREPLPPQQNGTGSIVEDGSGGAGSDRTGAGGLDRSDRRLDDARDAPWPPHPCSSREIAPAIDIPGSGAAAHVEALPARLAVAWERVEVHGGVPEHPEVAAIVARYQDLVATHMDQPLGRSFVPLDARFDTVRTRESNAGNLLGDVMRLGLDADAAFLNGGTIRSERVHEAGRMCMRDFVSMLPFTDELVVLELSGADVTVALETGVSAWPKREGRFLQVSGLSFAFDPVLPPGRRIIPGSVEVGGAPLDPARRYRVATKAYLRSGKDGFEALKQARVVVDGETAPRLATLVHYLLTRVEELNAAAGVNSEDDAAEGSDRGKPSGGGGGGTRDGFDGRPYSSCAAQEGEGAAAQRPHGSRPTRRLVAVGRAPVPPARCAHGLDALYYYDACSGQFGIAPQVEGRIRNTAVEAEPAFPACHHRDSDSLV